MKQLYLPGNPRPFWYTVLLLGVSIWLASCGANAVREEEAVIPIETLLAGTPSPTPPFTPTPTSTPTITPTPTPAPTDTPSPTPFPPTPTPNPALGDFGYCNQVAGADDGGRFSAQLNTVTTEGFPAFDRLVIDFTLAPDSAPLSAEANMQNERDFLLTSGEAVAPGAYVVQIQLPDWIHDQNFRDSVVTPTYSFTNTTILNNAELRFDPDADAGASILVGISEPVVYNLELDSDATRLTLSVASESALVEASDQLTLPFSTSPVFPDVPFFFLLDGDVWRADATGVISLTQSLEDETELAVSPDGEMVAFCRTQDPGFDTVGSSFAVPSSLWLMRADGTRQRLVAGIGVNCADPAFSPDGSVIAFSVDETGVIPAQRSIWTVPVAANTSVLTAAQRIAGDNEWSRFSPQWINDETIVYAADAPDGRSTLFLQHLPERIERDIGADLLVDEMQQDEDAPPGARYRALREPLVSHDGRAIAVAALRSDRPGADMVLLDANGVEQDQISEGYWTRPMAWGPNGELFYLSTACASTFIQDYTLFRRDTRGRDQLLAAGVTLRAIGDAAVGADGSLAYVVGARARPGTRGPSNVAAQSPSDLWLWNIERSIRGIVFQSNRDMKALVRGVGE